MTINPQDLEFAEREREGERMKKSSKRIWKRLSIIARSNDSLTM